MTSHGRKERPAPAPRPAGFEHGGVVLINKPQQHTSFDVVARVRRKLGLRRVGHAGTLDPMATGVLVVAFDWATRLVEYLTADAKTYVGVIRLGVTTDTDDAEGRVVSERPVGPLTDEELHQLAARFCGVQRQRPPAYSAVHVDGVRAHKLARAGAVVEIPERVVEIRRLELVRLDREHLRIEMEASAGTYVRSLARDLGEALGCGAHLTALQRVASGRFVLEDCVGIEAFEACEAPLSGRWALTPWQALTGLPTVEASDDEVRELRFGRSIDAHGVDGSVIRVGRGDELVALCRRSPESPTIRPFRVVPVEAPEAESNADSSEA